MLGVWREDGDCSGEPSSLILFGTAYGIYCVDALVESDGFKIPVGICPLKKHPETVFLVGDIERAEYDFNHFKVCFFRY